MLWMISLYNLKAGAAQDEFVKYTADNLARQEEYSNARGQCFIGLYRVEMTLKPGVSNPSVTLTATCAEVYLVEGADLSEAALREVQVTRSPEMKNWLDQRMTFIEPQGRARLWLEPIGLSAFAQTPIMLRERLLHLVFRHLPADKTVDELAEFDARIIARYAEHMAQAGWYHIGTYHLFGLPEYMYVDVLDVVDAATSAEALANDAAVPTPADVQAIYDECNQFLDRERERYELWLTPIVMRQAAQRGLRLD